MNIKYRFRLYPNIVCDDNKTLWQLEHFKNKRTFPLKKLTFNSNRKAFRIYSQWVTRKRLLELKIEVIEVLETDLSACDVMINQLNEVLNNS